MSMETGVEGGSMLVPELVWLSSASMRLVGGFIMFMSMFIGAAGVFCCAGICMDCISMPGMSGMRDCLTCAWMEGAVNRTSGSNVVASLWDMVIPSLDDCMVGGQRLEDAARREEAKEESDSKGYARRGRRRDG